MAMSTANLRQILERPPAPAPMTPGRFAARRPDPWFNAPDPVTWKTPGHMLLEAILFTVPVIIALAVLTS